VVLSLALGIGANTLVFSLVDAVLLRPFPFANSDQLVLLWGGDTEQTRRGLSGPDVVDLRADGRAFQGLAAFMQTRLQTDDSSLVNAAYVEPALFSVLGVQPAHGRGFLPDEDRAGRHNVAILSDAFWAGRYGRDPDLIGRTIRLDGEPYQVVGVMPTKFFFPDVDCQLWIPLSPSKMPALEVRGHALVHAIGRLQQDLTLAQAQADVDTVARRLEIAYPAESKGLRIGMFPLYRIVVGEYRTALWTLLGAVGFVLLIACANVANLLLASAVAREKDLAVRAALGAGRGRLIGHLLLESVMLAVLAGAAGVLLAYWGMLLVRGLGLADIPRIETAGIHLHVLGFTLGISLLTVLVFGLGPALVASRLNVSDTLARGGATSRGAVRSDLRDLLIAGEVALAVVLLVGAGLLVNSFARMARLDWGFRPENVLVVTLRPPASATTSGSSLREYIEDVRRRLEGLQGVESTALSYAVPLDYVLRGFTFVAVDGRVITEDRKQWTVEYVGPGYFRTLGIPVIRGREFTAQDGRTTRPVVVISQALAGRLWPGQDPVGRMLQLADLSVDRTVAKGGRAYLGRLDELLATNKAEFRLRPPREVVGVVGNVRMFGVELATGPMLYISMTEQLVPTSPFQIVLRTRGDPTKYADSVKALIVDANPGVRITKIDIMEELVHRSIGGRGANKLLLLVSVMFGSLGLVLAAGGVYGVMSYAVSQRTHEFGVRMALGAAPRDVIRLVMRHGSRLIAGGTALGVAGAWALTGLLSNFLFSVKPSDPATFAAAVVLLGTVGLLACLIPARRATRSDPADVLRGG
jgi:putative ABC transport system permease protein